MNPGEQLQPISPQDRWILDTSGNIVGVQNMHALGGEGRMLTAAQAQAVVQGAGNRGGYADTTALEAAFPAAANQYSTAWIGTQEYVSNGTAWVAASGGGGSGTVTSIAATVPSFLSISGSPITSSGTLALTYSGTALPVANGGTGITAFGTGVGTALGVNIGSAGAPVLFNGAGGTPSALTLTNATGLPPAGVTGTAAVLGANTFTGAQTVPAGTKTAPSVIFSGFAGGLYSFLNGLVGVSDGSKLVAYIYGGGASVFPVGIGFAALGTDLSVVGGDCSFIRRAAANFQFGAADAASPVAQTLTTQGSRAGTDSNIGGANLTVTSGAGTGTGALSILVLQSPKAVVSGTGAQTQVTGLTIKNGSPIIPAYTVANLPVAATNQDGMAIATDALTTLALGIGTTVAGGGANRVGVRSDGTNWVYSF